MNITTSTIYWLTRLDYIQGFFVAATIILGLSSFAVLLMYMVNKMDSVCFGSAQTIHGKLVAGAFGLTLVTVACNIFIPTTKEAAAMIVVPKLANSETVRGLGSDLVDLAHAWMKELRPGKEDAK